MQGHSFAIYCMTHKICITQADRRALATLLLVVMQLAICTCCQIERKRPCTVQKVQLGHQLSFTTKLLLGGTSPAAR